jgi:PadR family transcriptional regulator
MKKDVLGQFEQLVLMAVVALGEDAYGAAVHEKTLELAERPVTFGSVYITLDRLEDKGYLASKYGAPPEMGGKAKRYFRMRATGKQALRDALETSRRLQQTAEALNFT